jgi:hypothetical protein
MVNPGDGGPWGWRTLVMATPGDGRPWDGDTRGCWNSHLCAGAVAVTRDVTCECGLRILRARRMYHQMSIFKL